MNSILQVELRCNFDCSFTARRLNPIITGYPDAILVYFKHIRYLRRYKDEVITLPLCNAFEQLGIDIHDYKCDVYTINGILEVDNNRVCLDELPISRVSICVLGELFPLGASTLIAKRKASVQRLA